jgi:dihydroorotase
MSYDIVLRNAHVIDPSQDLSQVLDIGVSDGRIAGLGNLDPSPGAAEYDLRGKYLCPGLVDLHGHWYEGSLFGIDPDVCLNHGVTTVVDAGTSGFVNYHEFRKHGIESARIRVLAFLNIGAVGILTPFVGELQDLRYARPREAAEVLERESRTLLGVKIRIGANMTGENGIEALGRALEAAAPAGLPLMVHISKGAETPRILNKLRPRDILTHCFQGRGDGLLNVDRLVPEALAARARGVVFDVGHGCGSFSWDTARKAFEHHFYPDTISTDLHRFSIERWCIDMPTTMSKFLCLGMPLEDVILKTTWAPAMAIGKEKEIGTLRPGAAADIFVFDFDEGEFPLQDTHLKVVVASRVIRPRLTFKDGQPIEPGSYRACLRTLQACDSDVFTGIEESA